MEVTRVLLASCHGYIDPSSGAAVSSQELMELFASRGVDARVLSTGVLDYSEETPLGPLIAGLGLPYRRARAALSRGKTSRKTARDEGVEVYDMELRGVRVTLMPTSSSRYYKAFSPAETAAFLDLAEQVFDRFQPQIMLTYGGHRVSRELIARARCRGIVVVFHLRNFAYHGWRFFEDVDGLVVTTEYTRRHYAPLLRRDCKLIPNPIRLDRVVAPDRRPQYLTFVNPESNKGVTVFGRIAAELDRQRPDIPLLIVESRGSVDQLSKIGLDLSRLRNLHRMGTTPDPRDIYRVSRAVLMPSLWRETFGRVAAEAMANGVPVLASDRGALPETIGDGGFVLPIPARCTPASGEIPTAEEVAPWIEVIERLWDDPAWEAAQRARALESSRRWNEDLIVKEYNDFFCSLLTRGSQSESGTGSRLGMSRP